MHRVAPRHPRLIFSQKAFVFNARRKFLVLRRTKTAPVYPLSWDLPGGIAEQGENPKRAMRREIREETNIPVSLLVPFGIRGRIRGVRTPWLVTAYTARARGTKVSISWEHDRWRWVTVEEFLKLKAARHLKELARMLL